MKYIQIDQTNLIASRLGFGTGSLHHIFQNSGRQKLLYTAFESGITHFDTSPYYGYGLAESDLGEFIHSKRQELTISTKVGLYAKQVAKNNKALWLYKALGKIHHDMSLPLIDWNIKQAKKSLNVSLKRLRTDYIDFLFLHEPDPLLINTEEFLRWVEDLRSKGKIRYWGLAGDLDLFSELILKKHSLARIIQCKDSLDMKEADLILQQGRPLQFTFGYLSSSAQRLERETGQRILAQTLKRNKTGTVLVSTKHNKRIKELVGAVL